MDEANGHISDREPEDQRETERENERDRGSRNVLQKDGLGAPGVCLRQRNIQGMRRREAVLNVHGDDDGAETDKRKHENSEDNDKDEKGLWCGLLRDGHEVDDVS